MTQEKYLNLREQMGKEPILEEMPPDIHNFPDEIQTAMVIFNKLGDRVFPEIGYLGKDYTALSTYMDVYEIQNRKLFLEALLRLDANVIAKSAEKMKAARNKAKAK